MTHFNLSEYDFTMQASPRTKNHISDCVASIRVRGKQRKFSGHDIALSGFVNRTSKTGKSIYNKITIGQSKFQKRAKAIVVFDNDKLDGTVNIGHYGGAENAIVNSKPLVRKLFSIFDIELPTTEDSTVRFYFNLEEIEGMPKVFLIVPLRLEKISPDGIPTVIKFQSGESIKPKNAKSF